MKLIDFLYKFSQIDKLSVLHYGRDGETIEIYNGYLIDGKTRDLALFHDYEVATIFRHDDETVVRIKQNLEEE